MARKRYPSDENRARQRPHVKIHHSIRSHRKTVGHWDSPEFRGQILGLFQLATERFAANEDGWVHLSLSDIRFITGKSWESSASKAIGKLAVTLEYELVLEQIHPNFPQNFSNSDQNFESSDQSSDETSKVLTKTWSIRIPKLAKKQGFAPQLRTETTRTPPDSLCTDTEEQRTEEQSVSADAESRSGREPTSTDLQALQSFLGGLGGDADEKAAWINSGIGAEILGNATSELPPAHTSRQFWARCQAIAIARYRTYLNRGDRLYRGVAGQASLDAAIADWNAANPITPDDQEELDSYER